MSVVTCPGDGIVVAESRAVGYLSLSTIAVGVAKQHGKVPMTKIGARHSTVGSCVERRKKDKLL